MNYLNNPHYDVDEAQLDHFDQSVAKRQRYLLWKERLNQVELQIEKDEAAPDPDADLSPKKKRLKRQIKEEALLRLEEAARTEDDFAAVQYHWDCRDSNRERKERYREMLRGDVPLDVGIAKDPHVFPEWLGTPVAQQMRSGNYLDWLANCPYEMHDLLADAVLSSLICSLKEDAEPLDWIITALKDMTFPFITSKYFYEHGDAFDADEKKLMAQGVAAFGGIAPTYRIALLDKPTIVWDFHSLLIGLQMMFSFMMAEDKTPLRMCDSCDTIFVANRKTQRYCCDKCRRKGE